LDERRQPLTPQRLAIAALLLDADRPLSAEDVVVGLAQKGLKAGTATVYRTIDVLLESGLVIERDRGEGFRRFEANHALPHHEQLLCTACGSVVEFRDPALERMTHRLADTHGFVRERHRLVIYGTCSACSAAAASAAGRA
jgi:Fur family ferric uptake transcriptional regulator